jgi:hypothetical protein
VHVSLSLSKKNFKEKRCIIFRCYISAILVVCVPVPCSLASGTVGFFVVLSTFKKSLPCVSSLFLIKNTYSSNITTFNTAYIHTALTADRQYRGRRDGCGLGSLAAWAVARWHREIIAYIDFWHTTSRTDIYIASLRDLDRVQCDRSDRSEALTYQPSMTTAIAVAAPPVRRPRRHRSRYGARRSRRIST